MLPELSSLADDAVAGVQTLVPDPAVEPTLSIPRAGAMCGLGASQSYEAARRGVFPLIELSPNRSVVATAAWLTKLGFSDAANVSAGAELEDARRELEEACDAADRAAADHLAAVGRLREAVAVVRALSRPPAPELRAVR